MASGEGCVPGDLRMTSEQSFMSLFVDSVYK